jgi:hypothetical protein
MRKMHDAILFGPEQQSNQCHGHVSNVIQKGRSKRKGTSQRSADPISISLFRHILKWALDSGNIFVWVWTIAQWNLMARSKSNDPLALHNMSGSNMTQQKLTRRVSNYTPRMSIARTLSTPLYVLVSVWVSGSGSSKKVSKIWKRDSFVEMITWDLPIIDTANNFCN